MRRLPAVLVSGLGVYYAMAACSGSPTSGGAGEGQGASSGEPGSSSSSGASSSSGVVPNAMADTWHASGSRLKLRYYEASDGAKQFLGWRDTQRNEDCYFGLHADGSTRCMPSGSASISGYNGSTNCTGAPVAQFTKGAPAPKLAVRFENNGQRLYQAGAPYVGPISSMSGASCVDVTAYVTAYDFYSFGAEVVSGDFVSATMKIAP